MEPSYPLAAIAVGAVAAVLVATLSGALLVRLGFPLPAPDRRIGCIDGLRGYLALAVMVHHFVLWMQVTRLGGDWSAPRTAILNSLGSGGVALFFMTTGLVFYPTVLAGFRAVSWSAVMVNRAFRILPLQVVSIALVIGLLARRGALDPGAPVAAHLVAWLIGWDQPPLFGAPDSGRLDAYVLWSLGYEWLFYLAVLPACALAASLVRGRGPSWSVPAALLAGALLARLVWPAAGPPTYLPLFAVGMLAYEVQARPRLRQVFAAGWMAPLAGAGLAGAMLAAPAATGLAPLPFYGLFFLAVACGNDCGGLLRSPGARLLGECSFGLYLLHGLVLDLLFVEGRPLVEVLATGAVPVLLPVAGLTVACLAPVFALLVERPFIRAGRALTRGRHPRDRGLASGPGSSSKASVACGEQQVPRGPWHLRPRAFFCRGENLDRVHHEAHSDPGWRLCRTTLNPRGCSRP